MSSSSHRVSAIVVSFNVRDLLRRCLLSLEHARDAGELHEIIVIDSDSSDDSVAMVTAEFPAVRVEMLPNRGYGAAANAGYRLASGDLILTLNPDTRACDNAVANLVRAIEEDERIGLVGPVLRYPDGTTQPTLRRFPTPWTPLFESTIIEEWWPDNRWVRHYRMTHISDPASMTGNMSVDWLVGAAFLVRREVIEATRGFDESFFLYGEELEWCHRIRKHGWDIHFVPGATVIHHEAASTSQDRLGSRDVFDRGRVRAQRAIYGDAVARRTAWLLRLNYAIQLARESLKYVVGHRRELRKERIARYWRLVRMRLDD